MIFDAVHLPDGPVAEAWLPFHLPLSFHGTFTRWTARSPHRPDNQLMSAHTG